MKFTEIFIESEQSVVDADVLTVNKTLEMAKHHKRAVLSDDTDILVLLMYHFILHNKGHCIHYDKKASTIRKYAWNI